MPSLKEYNRKRDFTKTAEPQGRVETQPAHNRFVIQKHAASRLHYDFRLELDGTLKSWAVPKGVPYTKGEKRLAVQVEDHPISYIDFEGTIPKGEYGGGTVMVWDQGSFEALSADPSKELQGGKLHFILHGKKLQGEWYLVRLKEGNQWLLIKGAEDMPPGSAKADDTSALSGMSMEQLAKGDRVWHSNQDATVQPIARKWNPRKTAASAKPTPPPLVVGVRARTLKFIEPMMARLMESLPTGRWLYEIKFDGFRALAFKEPRTTALFSRNETDFSQKFTEVVQAVAALDVDSAVIDGEIVALDAEGRSSFQLLQAYELGEKRPPIFFYAFDLLHLNGKDLRDKPLTVRKAELEKIVKKAGGAIRFSESLEGEAADLLEKAREFGLEGLIAKRPDSKYEAGRRSGAWIKLKLHHEQEMVIGGYTNPEGGRQHFGALLVGYYEGGKLYFSGKVGTGFNDVLLRTLHERLAKLGQDKCPFVNLPEKRPGRYGSGLTPAQMKKAHWVKPELVCQTKFSEWTRDGKLRQPVFLGLREDKKPREVAREIPG